MATTVESTITNGLNMCCSDNDLNGEDFTWAAVDIALSALGDIGLGAYFKDFPGAELNGYIANWTFSGSKSVGLAMARFFIDV